MGGEGEMMGVGWGLGGMGWGGEGLGHMGRANCNHHLSLPDSGWLRLLVTISWGPNCHHMGPVWGPRSYQPG